MSTHRIAREAGLIPYGRQSISDADIEAVAEVLRSDFLTQGPVVPAFEEAVAALCGADHGVAMNSATSALHLACLALGVGPGDRVWTSPLTFVASSNAALYCGAEVDFVDVDERSYNMCPIRLEEKLGRAAEAGDSGLRPGQTHRARPREETRLGTLVDGRLPARCRLAM